MLNLWCEDALRAEHLTEVKQLKEKFLKMQRSLGEFYRDNAIFAEWRDWAKLWWDILTSPMFDAHVMLGPSSDPQFVSQVKLVSDKLNTASHWYLLGYALCERR